MARWLPALSLLLLVACSTRPASEPARSIDPATDPSVVGTVDEAVRAATLEAEEGAEAGRRIGHVAGVIAAVFGGPESESVDDMIDRYHRTRDIAETAGAIIGATNGGVSGARRGYELDLQFAELDALEGIEVTRPLPDLIEVRLADRTALPAVAAVLLGREQRAIEIEAAGDEALDVRESLIELGLPPGNISAHRDDAVQAILLRIRYLLP